MKQIEHQQQINDKAYHLYHMAMEQYYHEPWKVISQKPLRKCNACVVETTDFFILKSYRTYVAVIEKSSGDIGDVLRGVYGYTSTSCQHISKFIHDYTPAPWNNNRYTYYPVN